MGTKFDVEVNVGCLHNMCEDQGHRSKFRVTGCRNMIFLLDKKYYLLKYLVDGHQIWH